MKLSSLWQEFKAFAFKGNMIDLAVAVVIGAAFGAVINSLVKDIIMPSVSYVTTGAATAAHKAATVAQDTASHIGVTSKPSETQPAATQPAEAAAPPPPPPTPAKTNHAGQTSGGGEQKPVDFSWTIGRIKIGNFIAELINFIIVAFAVFIIIVKLLGSVMKRVGGTPAPSEPTTKECPFCLSVIPIKARKCAHCTADLPASSTVAGGPIASP
jgi:large conductance mechanosensitive channel